VIGDAVNVAARLQEACRERGVDVLASRTVRDAMDEPGGNESLQALGSMQLRGRSTSLDVYTLSESA
jgi:class 3 adenylate cyclase